MANWTAFMEDAWESSGTSVDYILVDARDIEPRVWMDCESDGSHACPYTIDSFPFQHSASTAGRTEREHDVYNCDDADESGPEVVYVFTTDESVTVDVSVDCDEGVDVDVYLLEGDDAEACIDRDNTDLSAAVPPGRYVLVVDTWVDGSGVELSGDYTIEVDLR